MAAITSRRFPVDEGQARRFSVIELGAFPTQGPDQMLAVCELGTTLPRRFPGVFGMAAQLMSDGELSRLELAVDRRECDARDRGPAFYADVDIGALAGRARCARTEQVDAVSRIGHMPPDHRGGKFAALT
jgi:hypothetical protein